MTVSLTPELEQYIAGKVSSGRYQTASEVVGEALQALQEKEKHERDLAELKAEIAIGIADCDAGRTQPFTEETIARIKERGRQRMSARADQP